MKLNGRCFRQIVDLVIGNLYPIYINLYKKIVVLASEPSFMLTVQPIGSTCSQYDKYMHYWIIMIIVVLCYTCGNHSVPPYGHTDTGHHIEP